MKRIILLSTGIAVALLSGCVTLSVYPYYSAKDVQFDTSLVGVWATTEKPDSEPQTWSFEKVKDQTYRLTIADKNEKTEFAAHLFKLKNYTFLDCLPREHSDYSTPCHILLKVDRIEPALELRPLDYEWLEQLLEKQPKAIRHIVVSGANRPDGAEGKSFVLTADTAELQKFILKHIETKEAWKELLVMKRP